MIKIMLAPLGHLSISFNWLAGAAERTGSDEKPSLSLLLDTPPVSESPG